ncbi:hypothetical protein ACIRU8_45575 [Streptomyces sp. NPDC101175]|uniref:hypothetical protein n=1 Tax=Streptomyces sp. NPDC101175 TaxID=3366123 RepID=UPI0038337738
MPDPSVPDQSPDQALAYPEPPAHPNWRRPGTAKPRPLTAAQQEHNREVLALALSSGSRRTRPRKAPRA